MARLEWRLANVTPACLHCCTASSADALLNASLSVSDAAGEAALQGISAHVLSVNGHAQEKGELLQAALNLSHSIKTLAGNLPCRVVQEKAALAPHQVPSLCVEFLQAAARRAGGVAKKSSATPKSSAMSKSSATPKSSAKSKPDAELVASAKRKSGADEEDEDEDAHAQLQVKSAKKGKTNLPAPAKQKPVKTPAKSLPPVVASAGPHNNKRRFCERSPCASYHV
jgi:hypothetical protein